MTGPADRSGWPVDSHIVVRLGSWKYTRFTQEKCAITAKDAALGRVTATEWGKGETLGISGEGTVCDMYDGTRTDTWEREGQIYGTNINKGSVLKI